MGRILDMAGRLTETKEFVAALGTQIMHKDRMRMPWDGLKNGGDLMLPAIKFDQNLPPGVTDDWPFEPRRMFVEWNNLSCTYREVQNRARGGDRAGEALRWEFICDPRATWWNGFNPLDAWNGVAKYLEKDWFKPNDVVKEL